MTQPQLIAFGILGAMMALFVWGRLRYDLVAVLALLASIAAGTVPLDDAFKGFSDDIVIIVASALVISAAVARSGVIEWALEWVTARIKRIRWQLTVLVTSVTLLSAFVKNIGALAMLMPAALKLAKKDKTSPAVFLMPMAFGSLLGGIITLVGTSPNIIVSRVREQLTGQPFGMFDYAPVGIVLAIMGIVFLRFGYRLLPRDRQADATMGEALDIKDYVTETTIGEKSTAVGKTVGDFLKDNEDEVEIAAILRFDENMRFGPGRTLRAGDVLMLRGEPDALERAIARDALELAGQDRTVVTDNTANNVGVIEVVVTANSGLIGLTPSEIALHDRFGMNLIAISRSGQRLRTRLRNQRLQSGDVLVLQGHLASMPGQLRELGLLPLAARSLRLGNVRSRLLPIGILVAAMGLTATGLVPVAIAFFGAAAAILLTGALPTREAYDHVDWPILVMLGALIPVSESLQHTGATDLIAATLSSAASGLPAWAALALILITAMGVTPFLNNAATVLVMAPIAATFAASLNYRPDAFLMAVAIGAGCDFLTPIGHQCNTLVMGPGGYRFGDYARLGAPLSVLVILVAVPMLLVVWPLMP